MVSAVRVKSSSMLRTNLGLQLDLDLAAVASELEQYHQVRNEVEKDAAGSDGIAGAVTLVLRRISTLRTTWSSGGSRRG